MKNYRSWLWVMVAIGWLTQTTAPAAISWKTNRAEAVTAAQASGKLILLIAGLTTDYNTPFMRTNMCERASIRAVIDPNYICWFANMSTIPQEWIVYTPVLETFSPPLICVIDPNDSLSYLDRTTDIQSDEAVFLARLRSHLRWDAGYTLSGGGWRRLTWFGDYIPMGGGWIWHNKHGFLYPTTTSIRSDIWFFTNDMGWLWTANATYPYLYRLSPAAWLWYNGATSPRWFRNMTTGTWESRP